MLVCPGADMYCTGRDDTCKHVCVCARKKNHSTFGSCEVARMYSLQILAIFHIASTAWVWATSAVTQHLHLNSSCHTHMPTLNTCIGSCRLFGPCGSGCTYGTGPLMICLEAPLWLDSAVCSITCTRPKHGCHDTAFSHSLVELSRHG